MAGIAIRITIQELGRGVFFQGQNLKRRDSNKNYPFKNWGGEFFPRSEIEKAGLQQELSIQELERGVPFPIRKSFSRFTRLTGEKKLKEIILALFSYFLVDIIFGEDVK